MLRLPKTPVIPALVLFLLSACDNEVDLFTSSEANPVVYCLLNPMEQMQYVRLGKTYTVTRTSYQNDPLPDSTSISWPVDIYMEQYNDNEDVEKIFKFTEIAFPERDSGLFQENSYRLFESKFQAISGKTYVLYVHFPDHQKIVSGKTIVMTEPEVLDPINVPYRMITLDSLSTFYTRWMPALNGGLYQGVFRFHYAEQFGGSSESKYVDVTTPIFSELRDDYIIEKQINPNNFFSQLNEKIKPLPDVIRIPIGIEYLFYATGSDLALQYQTSQSGSASFASIFEYTNLIGGVGIFTSWVKYRIPNLKLSPVSLRNLQTHPLTRDLGFQIKGQE